ncbi:urease accessory protein UreD [Dulcicalothrix desertica PCC 7102]|uniref:Urease accessory protein UreD n=1 Tax=Dulcicalothrix desertica PCC 7102 TaxID=232991 RepID=A0A3S1IUE9_9CYAN|nr:urease accessory protein UreD [Dulcicalothrix desertica]RUT02574.1 urease accessory protein UreD [Dulcicalothrix desertica PCC 7102]TWH55211.1 urease accessory protein [Dulcicalothrix desertica PCC 7102]
MVQNISATLTSNSWHGKLDLLYANRQGTTQLIQAHHTAPLKVQRPFYPEGKAVCHSVILHTAGGVVGGDKLSCKFQLHPESQVLITTAAAGKIYRSNGRQATQNIDIEVSTGATLEWLPQETIIFDGAIYRQDTRIDLAENATLIGWEITRFGRSARGEKFLQGNWKSNTEVWQQGKPLWVDRQWLPGSEEVFHSPHALNGQPVVGTLVFVGQAVPPEIIEKARSYTQHSTLSTQHSFGVTRLEHGFLCRYRGSSTSEVRNWFTAVWQLLRQSLLGRSDCIPRVWQI